MIGGNGLSDGFRAHLVPTQSEYAAALKEGIVALDANVLLNAYRYHDPTRADFFAILESLAPRLFVPHQAAKEFWRNRESTIREALGASERLHSELSEAVASSAEALARWANRSGLAGSVLKELTGLVSASYEEVRARVQGLSNGEVSQQALDTASDPVLQRLLSILNGAVGEPYAPEALDQHSLEAARRIEAKEPPGFKDAGKPGADAHGDYLLWRQILDVASERSSDVVLVTSDVKEDWWRRESGQTRGPRLELLTEFAEATGGRRLFMLRPPSLIERAKDSLSLEIRDDSVAAAEQIDRFSFDRNRRDYYASADLHALVKLPGGRSASYVDTLMQMTELVEDASTFEDLIERFQEAFPSITLASEARRRVGVLAALGLAELADDAPRLTDAGRTFLEGGDLELLKDLFMSRIGGAAEVRRLASVASRREVRRHIRHDPPDGLSPTQAALVLRWMEQLDLLPSR